MSRHTKGPWKLYAGGTIKPWAQIRAPHEDGTRERIITDTTGWGQDYHESTANAERIVECVNACDGIEDPSVVPELLKALKRATLALRANYHSRRSQAPVIESAHRAIARAGGGKKS